MPSKRIDFDAVREIALALPDVEEATLAARCSNAKGICPVADLPGASQVSRAELAGGANWLRSAREFAGRPPCRLLPDGSLCKLPNCPRATGQDRPKLLEELARHGLAIREFEEESDQDEDHKTHNQPMTI